jgi:hypothetical protein
MQEQSADGARSGKSKVNRLRESAHVALQIVKEYPELKRYESYWPVKECLIAHLKITSKEYRDKQKVNTACEAARDEVRNEIPQAVKVADATIRCRSPRGTRSKKGKGKEKVRSNPFAHFALLLIPSKGHRSVPRLAIHTQ